MSKFFCMAVNGLDEALFGNPLSQLADYLNKNTPDGIHFNVTGGADPRPYVDQFTSNLAAAHAAGNKIIILGHSLGAMMMFYLADAMKKAGIALPLVISIDSTDWGTNAPSSPPYSMGTSTPGQYWVPDNADRWIHFRQPAYPGGGVAQLALGNLHTIFENYERFEAHVVLPVTPDIQSKILEAVIEASRT